VTAPGTVNILSAENLEGRVDVARALGSTATLMFIYDVAPGERQSPYHYEYDEEWLLVVDGTLVLRAPDGEHTLQRGDIVCFPAGPAGAHQLINRSDSPGVVAAEPVLAHGREDVEHDRVDEGLDLVRDVRRQRHGRPRLDDALLAADHEADASLEHGGDLLVLVLVHRHDGALSEGYASERHRLRVDQLPADRVAHPLDRRVAPSLHLHRARA
jgi:uncharacterized cupin superfamily protein